MSWFCQQYLIFNSSPAEQLVAVADLRVGGEDGVGHKELVGGPAEEEGCNHDYHQLHHLGSKMRGTYLHYPAPC